ncbi:hypothetical protein U8Q06_20925 [Rhizobium beringeri]|uniref:hypothetical protein n=1 Tax=Rhizobium beringeri TaxID=3019934 RepID=UPI002E13012B|nr:hypothetical protein U8Q06_20925 [Rhizobium beringeri]
MRRNLRIDPFRLVKLETAVNALNAAALRAGETYNITIKERTSVEAEIRDLEEKLVNPRGYEVELKADLKRANSKLDEISKRLDHLRAKTAEASEQFNADGLVFAACERFLASLKKQNSSSNQG